MADIIHLLPDVVANQIAAGEVIQRPASVIKELMENSIDAGADKIDVWVTDAGKTSIKVVDNGKGMSETDARLSFERHATSKIKDASDLFRLHTMGFRGEALASIAAVAQVELCTRTIDDELGISLSLSNAKVIDQHPVACQRGAQFTVNNLFYNVPARRRFLKSDVTEMKNIMQEFERVALIHPDVEFTLHRDGNLLLDLRSGSFKKRIVDIFGASLDKNLLPIHVETSLVTVDGFVGTPESARVKGVQQFFFVNERYMRHPYFHRAVMSAYERLVPQDRQVAYFIMLEVDPSRIDVNIHPTKTEIKFSDEQAIWQILMAVIKEALGRFNEVPSIDFTPASVPSIPTYNPQNPKPNIPPQVSVQQDYNPFDKPASRAVAGQGGYDCRHSAHPVDPHWEALYGSPRPEREIPGQQDALLYRDAPEIDRKEWEAEGVSCMQYDRYIITSSQSGLMVIDQHRAHIRVLYDKFLARLAHHDGISQGLLFPELFQIPVSQSVVLNRLLDDFKAVGFDIASMGGGSYAVKGVPAGTERQNSVDFVMYILSQYGTKETPQSTLHSSIALTLAKNNAILPNQQLTKDEMNQLIADLLSCQTPKYTPDGHQVMAILDADKLKALLK